MELKHTVIQAPDVAPDSRGPDPVDSLGRDEVPRAEELQYVVLDCGHIPLVVEKHGKHFDQTTKQIS